MACTKYYGCDRSGMNIEKLITNLISELGSENVRQNEPMSGHTTFKTGGNADLLLLPRTEQQIIAALRLLYEYNMPHFFVGRGSNLLVSDDGIRGAVIKIADGFDRIHVSQDGVLTAQAGAPLHTVCMEAVCAGFGGLEFAGGIPGCLGGGVMMNAGAYGGELKDFVSSVDILTPDLEKKTMSHSEMEFGYRSSVAQKKGFLILGASFRLCTQEREACLARMNDFNSRRREKQPLTYPSAGSTFKRPKGAYAGTLIEQTGLKGFTIGGAQVSEKHAGFIINLGSATSRDIYELIDIVRKKVLDHTGILLEPEVKMLGEF